MLSALFTSVISFVSTNLDDLLVLMLLYAQAQTAKERRGILAGQYLGTAILLCVSLASALGLGLLPENYLRFLGLIPIVLGLRIWFTRKKHEPGSSNGLSVLSVTLFALSNGADNIGIYIPLFVGQTPGQAALFIAVYALLLFFWCMAAKRLAALPLLGEQIRKYQSILVPAVFILLGLYILLK